MKPLRVDPRRMRRQLQRTAVKLPRMETHDGQRYVYLADGRIARTVELSDAVYVDLDRAGKVLGVEILSDVPPTRWKITNCYTYNDGRPVITIDWGTP